QDQAQAEAAPVRRHIGRRAEARAVPPAGSAVRTYSDPRSVPARARGPAWLARFSLVAADRANAAGLPVAARASPAPEFRGLSDRLPATPCTTLPPQPASPGAGGARATRPRDAETETALRGPFCSTVCPSGRVEPFRCPVLLARAPGRHSGGPRHPHPSALRATGAPLPVSWLANSLPAYRA